MHNITITVRVLSVRKKSNDQNLKPTLIELSLVHRTCLVHAGTLKQ
jgi:hypothetical protein